MDKNAFTASQAFESYLWYHVLFLGVSLFGLILNNGTVRSNPFVIYKTTSMLCAGLGVRCENWRRETNHALNYLQYPQTHTKLYTLFRTDSHKIIYPV